MTKQLLLRWGLFFYYRRGCGLPGYLHHLVVAMT